MIEQIAGDTAHFVARLVELFGIAIIALGAFGNLGLFAFRLARGTESGQAVGQFRSSLGRAILLGLEFLVAADIINTVAVRPTLNSIAVLAGIVAIRTFLSFSLEVEIEGHWPWARRKGEQREV